MNNNSDIKLKEHYTKRYLTKILPINKYTDYSFLYINEYVPVDKKSKILDVGCGDARHARELLRLGYTSISAVDLFDKLLDDAINYQTASVEAMPFDDGVFDFAYAMGSVVNYVSPPEKGINEIARVVRSGGTCLISSHTLHSTHTLFRRIRRKLGIKSAAHLGGLTFYSTRHMIKALEQAGLKVLFVDGYKPSMLYLWRPAYRRILFPALRAVGVNAKPPSLKIAKSTMMRRVNSIIGYHAVYYCKKL